MTQRHRATGLCVGVLYVAKSNCNAAGGLFYRQHRGRKLMVDSMLGYVRSRLFGARVPQNSPNSQHLAIRTLLVKGA